MLRLVLALSVANCKLEEKGMCNFANSECIFQDNVAAVLDLDISLDGFM